MPVPARAQQPAMPVVGYLGSGSAVSDAFRVPAFRQGLSEAGFVEGQNVTVDYRWAEEQYDRLPAMATDLVNRHVAVIVATSTRPTRPWKCSTRSLNAAFTGAMTKARIVEVVGQQSAQWLVDETALSEQVMDLMPCAFLLDAPATASDFGPSNC